MGKVSTLVAIASIAAMTMVYPAGRVGAATNNLPVLFVHGIVGSPGCPSVSTKQAAPLASVLAARGYTGRVRMVGYYCGETQFAAYIVGAGDRSYFPTAADNYNATTPIEKISNDLAWYVYRHYSRDGQFVNVAASSMGGLIVRFAVQMVQAGNSHFPPYLLVANVWTYSAPYDGVDRTAAAVWQTLACGSYPECNELLPGSAFLAKLHRNSCPRSRSGPDYTTEGGGPADTVVSYASSSDISCAHRVNYFAKTPVNYNHDNGLTDTSTLFNEPRTLTQPDGSTSTSNGAHSLLLAAKALVSSSI